MSLIKRNLSDYVVALSVIACSLGPVGSADVRALGLSLQYLNTVLCRSTTKM